MKWFTFRQNNSGGSFITDVDRGIAINVIIEAPSARIANALAENIGLYFDGDGDCECCGDRWSEMWSDSDGEDSPSIYGRVVEECEEGEASRDWNTYLGFIHPLVKPFRHIKYKE